MFGGPGTLDGSVLSCLQDGRCCVLTEKSSAVKVAQSYPTLCNPTGYTVHGIFQAIILEWVAFSFSRGSSQARDRSQVSHIAGGFFTS